MSDSMPDYKCGNCKRKMKATKDGDITNLECPNCGRKGKVDKDGSVKITKNGEATQEINPMRWVGIGFGVLVLIILALSALAFIPAGSEGVLLNWGAVSGAVLPPGLHFIVPIYQTAVPINTQVQAYSVLTGGTSKDLQQVPTEITLDYNINASQVNELYQKVGLQYQQNIVQPIVQENVKAVEANFTAQDLINNRTEVQAQIQQRLSGVLPRYYVIVDQLSIVNFSFSPQFSAAIEAKVAQQQILQQQEINVSIAGARANITIALAVGNKTSQILRAEGNATAVKIRANATAYAATTIQNAIVNNPDYIRWLEISEWNGKLPTTVVGNNGALPLINLNASAGTGTGS